MKAACLWLFVLGSLVFGKESIPETHKHFVDSAYFKVSNLQRLFTKQIFTAGDCDFLHPNQGFIDALNLWPTNARFFCQAKFPSFKTQFAQNPPDCSDIAVSTFTADKSLSAYGISTASSNVTLEDASYVVSSVKQALFKNWAVSGDVWQKQFEKYPHKASDISDLQKAHKAPSAVSTQLQYNLSKRFGFTLDSKFQLEKSDKPKRETSIIMTYKFD